MSRCRLVSVCAGAVVVASSAVPTGAAGAPKPITGRLSAPGHTLIALAADGGANSVLSGTGSFRLRPRAKTVTLHLRGPNGVYAGPVVIRPRGRLAILGVREGARLGTIRVRAGYATLARPLRHRWVDTSRVARARGGVPIGARVFGRVRSKPPSRPVPGDRDRDGIPGPLDIDDDGDRILDGIDRPKRARTAQARQEFPFELNLAAPIEDTANANAAGLTTEQMDQLLVRHGHLVFAAAGEFAELDCGLPQARTETALGGLSYCTKGGTGRLMRPGPGSPDLGAFPDDFDPDGDGYGTVGAGVLRPRATTAQIGTGDVLIQRVSNSDGVETGQFAATLTYVFATVSALASYNDGRGNSVKVEYPVASPNCGSPPCPPPGLGTRDNPFPVKAGASGDVVLEMSFWRPQRRAIPPETSEWIDVGGLTYGAGIGRDCPQAAFTTTDPLAPDPLRGDVGEDGSGGLRDLAADRTANPANTITYKLNLSACLRARSADFAGPEDWRRGETKVFSFSATDQKAYTGQELAFRLQ